MMVPTSSPHKASSSSPWSLSSPSPLFFKVAVVVVVVVIVAVVAVVAVVAIRPQYNKAWAWTGSDWHTPIHSGLQLLL